MSDFDFREQLDGNAAASAIIPQRNAFRGIRGLGDFVLGPDRTSHTIDLLIGDGWLEGEITLRGLEQRGARGGHLDAVDSIKRERDLIRVVP